jgi:opacity protein-like surface antigen
MYRYGFTEAGVTGSNTKTGFDFGGGTEYFFTPDATITLEGLYHRVGWSRPTGPGWASRDRSGRSRRAKKYF